MICDWQAFLKLIPQWMRKDVDDLGKAGLQELRLRTGQPAELVLPNRSVYLVNEVSGEDLEYCLNAASQYSPWSATTVSKGYITAGGGHRIGICGNLVMAGGNVKTVNRITSLCIRVARDYPNIAANARGLIGSILIIGSPGRGKTTLLRDLIRLKSNDESKTITVVDERGELFPLSCGKFCFHTGNHTDILSGCGKAEGIEMLIRTMNPHYVAVDEITAIEDCNAIVQARGCGVSILATAHAADMREFMDRPVYKPILDAEIFKNIIIMQPDKSWKLERVNL